jgi:hypothetical protein
MISSLPVEVDTGEGGGDVDEGISDVTIDACISVQSIFSKQDVPGPHMESPSLHVCKVNEQDDSTSAKLAAQ